MPVLLLSLNDLFYSLGFVSPIALDPWIEILTVFALLSFLLTPIGIVYYFTTQGVKGKLRKTGLGILTVVIYFGYFCVGAPGVLTLPLPWSWLSFLSPTLLTLLLGWGLAHKERAIQNGMTTPSEAGETTTL